MEVEVEGKEGYAQNLLTNERSSAAPPPHFQF